MCIPAKRNVTPPMTMRLAITPLRLDFDHTIRIDRRWPETYGIWWEKYKPKEEQKAKVYESPVEELYVRGVKGDSEASPGQEVKYEVTRYSKDSGTVSKADRDKVVWAVMIDGKTTRLKIDGKEMRGEKISFKIPEEWAGKKVTLMPYLHSPEKDATEKVTKIKKRFPMLILQGNRRKGRNQDNTGIANDLKYDDYSEDDSGYEKLKGQLFVEIYKEEKQDGFFDITSRSDNAINEAKNKIEEIRKLTEKSDTELFEIFENDIEWFSMGKLEDVAHEMINRMKRNLGGEYSNSDLTDAVRNHENSRVFIQAVKKVIQEYVAEHNGSINGLEIKDNSTGQLYKNLRRDEVNNPRFSDKLGGLGITINDMWAYQVFIRDYKTNANSYSMKLDIIYNDHFGLDYPDLAKFDKDIFYSWFILQHFRGYKPFITTIKFSEEWKGTF